MNHDRLTAAPIPLPQTRGALVSAAGPAMHAVLHDLALPTFGRYAEQWDWSLLVEDLPSDGAGADPAAQQAKWTKLRLLRQALERHPLALWVDADVLVLRDDDDITAHLHPGHFQALALEHVPAEHRVNPNTGVWLMRSCPQAFAFLDAVEAIGPQPGPWADQGGVLAALGWDRGEEDYRWARPGRGNDFLAATSWLPPGWNSPYLHGRRDDECFNSAADSYAGRPQVLDPHALHFMGMSPAARYRAMAAVAGAAAAQTLPTSAAAG